jgi:hypothetical protein
MNNVRDNKDNQELGKPVEACKHKTVEFDESTGCAVCQDCWTTLRPRYSDHDANFGGK